MTDETTVARESKPRRKPPKVRGLFERPKGSGIWWVSYKDCAGTRRREKAGTRGMAQALLERRRDERRRGVKLPETIRRRGVAVRELLDLGAAHVAAHYSTVRLSAKTGQQRADSRHPALAVEFGLLDAAKLTPQRIEQGLARLAAERNWKPATANRHKAFLSLAYRLGVANGKVSANPARLVRAQREDNGRIRLLSPAEEARLRAVIRERWPEHEPEFDLAVNTGMRSGEQYGLTWDRVDCERRQIALYRTKNKHPRYIPLNPAALAALRALRQRSAGIGPVILHAERMPAQAAQKARHWFEQAVRLAAVPEFTWHCLRHTFASRLVMAGVDLRTVAELMGHRTLAMTFRYAHLAPQHQLEAVERLAGFATVQSGTRSGTGDSVPSEAGPENCKQAVSIQ